jgi:hypothetical protein
LGGLLAALPQLTSLNLRGCYMGRYRGNHNMNDLTPSDIDRIYGVALTGPLPDIIYLPHLVSFDPYEEFAARECEIAPRLRAPHMSIIPTSIRSRRALPLIATHWTSLTSLNLEFSFPSWYVVVFREFIFFTAINEVYRLSVLLV